MIALGVTPGVVRDALAVPDEPWHAVPHKFHDLLAQEIARARSRQCVPADVMFEGSDAYPGALALARRCLAALERVMPGISQVVRFEVRGAAGCFRGDRNSDGMRHLLCCNPPWGDRLDGTQPSAVESEIKGPSIEALSGPEEGLAALCASWRDLGELAHRFFGSVWILNPVSLSPELREEFHNAAYRQGSALTNAEQHFVDGGIRQTASHGKLGLEWSRIVPE
jgi:23S rRNA G2445 N2-methylase RlmL